MAIIDLFLTDVQGTFESDTQEIRLEWVAFSDDIRKFAYGVMMEGMSHADGWRAPGTPYHLGTDAIGSCLAEKIEVLDRKIIDGKGDYEIRGVNYFERVNENAVVRYTVVQRYATPETEDNNVGNEPTENDKFTLKMSYEWEDMPLSHDVRDDRPVFNSAGAPFNPPVVRRRKIPIYSITRREYFNPLMKAKTHSNTVNTEIYLGAAPETLLMDSIVCDFDGKAWTVTYNIKERIEGWQTYVLDTGYYQRGLDGKLYSILGDDALPISEPVKLDGYGRALLNQALPGVNIGPYHKYQKSAFGVLRLPNPFVINSIYGQ